MKPLSPAAGRTPGGPGTGPRVVPRVAPGVGAKASRGTIMGAKQALRAAHSRVNELAAGGAHSRSGLSWGSADSDSGNDSGVNVSEERPPVGPALPSPYSKVTAPRRPQRYSSGHGSDNSSVLSGELPPAMGKTALFYHSGGSSGYESMMRDSEATGSASSAQDSMSENSSSVGGRCRSLKAPKKRTNSGRRGPGSRRVEGGGRPRATAMGAPVRQPRLSPAGDRADPNLWASLRLQAVSAHPSGRSQVAAWHDATPTSYGVQATSSSSGSPDPRPRDLGFSAQGPRLVAERSVSPESVSLHLEPRGLLRP